MADRLSWSQLFYYALPGIALGLPTVPIIVYLPTYYAQTLGLGLTVAGGALFAARLFDVITDPLIGFVSDRLPARWSPWGRRKPLILLGAPLAGLALVQLLDPPAGAGVGHLVAWGFLLYGGWTLVMIPYTAWGAELSGDYGERSRITGAREGALLLGIFLAGAAPAALAASGWSEADALAGVAWSVVAFGAPAFLLLGVKLPEKVTRRVPLSRPAHPLRGLGSLARNRPFLRLLAAWFVNGLANGIPAVLFLLYMEHALEAGPADRGLLIFLYFLAAVLAIPLWLRLGRRHDKHRVWCLAMLMAIASFAVVPFLPAGAIFAFALICLLTGAALGADLVLPPSIQADVVDYDRLRFGEDRTGILFAAWSMATKLALAAAVGIALPSLDALGFDPESGSPEGLTALVVIYAGIPVVLKVGAIVLVWSFPLTRARHAIIRRRLTGRPAA